MRLDAQIWVLDTSRENGLSIMNVKNAAATCAEVSPVTVKTLTKNLKHATIAERYSITVNAIMNKTTEYVPSVVAAVMELKKRYVQQCLQFPLTSRDITEAEYVAVNLPYKLRNMKMKHMRDAEVNHASDCAYWVSEPCNCLTARDCD